MYERICLDAVWMYLMKCIMKKYFLIYNALYVLYICFDLQIWRKNKLKYKYVRFYNCKIRK